MRASKHRIVVVDLGSSHVAAGVFAVRNRRLELCELAYAAQSIGDDAAALNTAVQCALGSLTAAGPRIGCELALSSQVALTKFVRMKSVASRKRAAAIAIEAAAQIPIPLDQLAWDHAILGADGATMDCVIAAAKAEWVNSICAELSDAGFAAQSALPAGLALYHAFRSIHASTSEPVFVADIGSRSTQLMFLRSEHFHLRAVACGGDTVTQALAAELGVDFASAERIKVRAELPASGGQPSSPESAALARATATLGTRLAVEIRRTMLREVPDAVPGAPLAVYLTGGGSMLPLLGPQLATELKASVEKFDPLARTYMSDAVCAEDAMAFGPALAALVGVAAARLLGGHGPQVNLLPLAMKESLAVRRRRPRIAATAACIVLAHLAPLFHLQRKIDTVKRVGAETEALLVPLRRLQATNARNLEALAELRRRMEGLQPAYDAQSGWIPFMADLQQRLYDVEDVWVDALALDRGPPVPELRPAPTARRGVNNESPAPLPIQTGRLILSGRLLDPKHPQTKVSAESLTRAKQLLASLVDSEFIAGVENERYDTTENGLLHFDFTLLTNPRRPL